MMFSDQTELLPSIPRGLSFGPYHHRVRGLGSHCGHQVRCWDNKGSSEYEDAFKTDPEVGSRVHIIGEVFMSRNWTPRLAAKFIQAPGPQNMQFSDLHYSLLWVLQSIQPSPRVTLACFAMVGYVSASLSRQRSLLPIPAPRTVP